MRNVEIIFDNVTEFTPKELAQYIMDGLFTMDELCDYNNTCGQVTPKIRRQIQDILQRNIKPNF